MEGVWVSMHFSDTFSKCVIFSEKIYYEFETFRTTKIAPIFNGLLSKNHEKLHLVAQIKQNSNQILLDIKNIYKGLNITIWRNFSSVGMFFWGYETTKKTFQNPYIGSFVGGSVAGFMSWGPNYPLDNIKTRIQTDVNGNYNGIMDCIKKTYKTTGFRSFWSGFSPCIIRGMIVNPFIFLAYEIGINNFQ